MSDSNFLILTCDGGGIRGLITALILQELQKELNFLGGIDLFAGTSTGGLIALGLASGVSIDTLVKIYSDGNCSQIFTPYKPPSSNESPLDSLVTELANSGDSGNGLFGILGVIEELLYVKYNNTGLMSVLKNNLTQPDQFLVDLQSKVLVTTFQLYNEADETNPSWRPITLDNLPKNPFNSEKTKVIDAALCTSAAPLYFPPHIHPNFGLCIDGGVFANNPSTLALARVLRSGILEGRNIENIRILSIGTGQTQNYMPPDYQSDGPLRYGPTTWFWPEIYPPTPNTPKFPLLSILMDGSSIIDNFQTKMFLGEENYQRINIELTDMIPLDGCSQIGLMQELVTQYISSSQWKDQVAWIKENFSK